MIVHFGGREGADVAPVAKHGHALGDFHCGNQAKVANAARHHLLAKADGYRIPAGTRQIQPEFRTGLMHQKIATGSTVAHVVRGR